jgi:hypothetical protein
LNEEARFKNDFSLIFPIENGFEMKKGIKRRPHKVKLENRRIPKIF